MKLECQGFFGADHGPECTGSMILSVDNKPLKIWRVKEVKMIWWSMSDVCTTKGKVCLRARCKTGFVEKEFITPVQKQQRLMKRRCL